MVRSVSFSSTQPNYSKINYSKKNVGFQENLATSFCKPGSTKGMSVTAGELVTKVLELAKLSGKEIKERNLDPNLLSILESVYADIKIFFEEGAVAKVTKEFVANGKLEMVEIKNLTTGKKMKTPPENLDIVG